jgi:hypothetical protein
VGSVQQDKNAQRSFDVVYQLPEIFSKFSEVLKKF